MKRILLALALVLPLCTRGQSSTDTRPPLYQRYPEVPPFSMVKAGGEVFTNRDLKKHTPTMIILFSVDCEHCMHETEDLTKNIDRFKGTQIVMVTRFRYEPMMSFYAGYGIGRYPNIIMGSDSTARLNSFYHLRYFPGIYIYNKDNQLVYNHEGTAPVDTLLHYLKPR